MKTARRIFALTLVFILTIGVSACMGPFQSNKSRMLKHLKEKYNGQEFVPIRMDSGGDWFHISTAILYCYPKGGDPEADEVSVTMNLDSKKFTDTYFGILIREELESELLATISDLPLPMKVYCRFIDSFDESLDGTKTFADFKEWQSESKETGWLLMHGGTTAIDPGTTIVTTMDGADQTEKEEYVKQIFDRLVKDGYKDSYHGWVGVRFYPSEVFEKVKRGNYIELYEETYPFNMKLQGLDYLSGTIYDGVVKLHFDK